MMISIDIDDKDLKEIATKGIKNLGQQEIDEIAKKALLEYLSAKNTVEYIVFDGNGYSGKRIRPEFMAMLERSFTKEELEEQRKKIFKYVDERGEELMFKTLAEVFSKMLMTDEFKAELAREFMNIDCRLSQVRNRVGLSD